MSDGRTAIWTPDGLYGESQHQRERVELRKGLSEWLRQFSDFAEHFQLGIHCSRCQADLVGKNSDSDKVFTVACKCREFIGTNRDYIPPPQVN
jgi:hypothetical protein